MRSMYFSLFMEELVIDVAVEVAYSYVVWKRCGMHSLDIVCVLHRMATPVSLSKQPGLMSHLLTVKPC